MYDLAAKPRSNVMVSERKRKMFNVYARFRPTNEREKRETDGRTSLVANMCDERRVTINGTGPGNFGGLLSFNFDHVFYENAKQTDVYERCVAEHVDSFVEFGQDCNILSYGQTSSGKTWTIDGTFYEPAKKVRKSANGGDTPVADGENGDRERDDRGVMPRVLRRLCDEYGDRLTLACYEIYCEKIVDLLNDNGAKDECRFTEINGEITIGVTRASYHATTGAATAAAHVFDHFAAVLRRANRNRHFASTAMNSTSSRSHTFIEFACPTAAAAANRCKFFRVVDLAGSERAAKTQAKDKVLNEGININNSLMYLKQLVELLAAPGGNKTLPKFRESKLARIVYTSVKNNDASVVVLLCCSPALSNVNETINTLRFGSTATKITRLTRLTADEQQQPAAGVRETALLAERERQRLEILTLERRFNDELSCERDSFQRRLSDYESEIKRLTAQLEEAKQEHLETQRPMRVNGSTTTDAPTESETYARCRQTIELQRLVIDKLTDERKRLNDQIEIYNMFKSYMLSNLYNERDHSEHSDTDDD